MEIVSVACLALLAGGVALSRLRHTRRPSDAGQNTIEYGLLVAVLSFVAIGLIVLIGPQLQGGYQTVVNNLQTGSQSPPGQGGGTAGGGTIINPTATPCVDTHGRPNPSCH